MVQLRVAPALKDLPAISIAFSEGKLSYSKVRALTRVATPMNEAELAAIKRALWSRDGGCRFPGCTSSRYIAAHHVRHWVNGGETSIDNTMLLCSRHHRLVHEGGYVIREDCQGRWYFRRLDGRAIPAHGYQPDDIIDDGIDERTYDRDVTHIEQVGVPAGTGACIGRASSGARRIV